MPVDLEQLADAPFVKSSAEPERNGSGTPRSTARLSEDRQASREPSHRDDDRRRDSRDRERRDDRRDDRRDERRSERRRDDRREHRHDDRDRHDRRRSRSPRKDSGRHERSRSDHAAAEVDRAPSRNDRNGTPPVSEEERDSRTVFVQQLAQRLRTKELIRFFEKAGPVRDAQIVKDKISGRSKGVGYVEFKSQESVVAALQLTGQKLLGIPVIAQLTEAEKNRQAREEAIAQGKLPGRVGDVPFHRLYVGNIHFNVGEEDLQAVFEPFGDLEFVSLQKDPESGRSRGYGFVQFKETAHAREALEKMNGFDLAGRPIRVGLGNDKFVPEGAQNIQGRFSSKDFERDDGPPQRRERRDYDDRDLDGQGGGRRRGDRGVRELDDSEQGGVSFQNISRTDLMRKLARAEDNIPAEAVADLRQPPPPPQVSRGVLLKNMFNPAEETEPNWQKELGDDVTAECNEKYGEVVHCHVEENSLGEIYVKFKSIDGGKAAIEGLNGRWFGGRTIGAEPLLDAIYNTKFPAAKSL